MTTNKPQFITETGDTKQEYISRPQLITETQVSPQQSEFIPASQNPVSGQTIDVQPTPHKLITSTSQELVTRDRDFF